MCSSDLYHAVNAAFEGLKVPLEMQGSGAPQLLDWDRRRAPIGQIGLLRYTAGQVDTQGGAVAAETTAILDVQALAVLAMLPERLGEKRASWSWENGRVVVTAADGATDDIVIRGSVGPGEALPPPVAGLQQRRPGAEGLQKSASAPPPWVPWAQPQPQ